MIEKDKQYIERILTKEVQKSTMLRWSDKLEIVNCPNCDYLSTIVKENEKND